jgi:hypothetical protein
MIIKLLAELFNSLNEVIHILHVFLDFSAIILLVGRKVSTLVVAITAPV